MIEEVTHKKCKQCGGTGLEDSWLGWDSDPCPSCAGAGLILVPYEPGDEDE